MNYPLISEYIEAIKAPEDNFDKLTHLFPVLDNNGQPIMSSGNFAVVFKMEDSSNGKLYAVKCFLKEQENRAESYRLISDELEHIQSSYLISIKYLNKELFVDSNNASEEELPVVLMDWVEGETLDKYIRNNIDDKYQLSLLAYQFSRLSKWLLTQPFAHGDLKPDNIIVRNDGTLTLVDYDGMYVPAMRGQKARELGSPDFRHPSRTEDVFDEHIDDFSIASIMLSLKAIAVEPELLDKYGAEDRLLLSEEDYRDISRCQFINEIFSTEDLELRKLVSLFNLATLESNFANISFRLFSLKLPQKSEFREVRIMTKITLESKPTWIDDNGLIYYENETAWIDEYGGMYNENKKGFLKMKDNNIIAYSILDGISFINENALQGCSLMKEINIPNSVIEIGKFAFHGCRTLKNINIPNSVKHIGHGAFIGCESLDKIIIPDSVTKIGEVAFYRCKSLKKIRISNSITEIKSRTFEECKALKEMNIPSSVTSIGERAFSNCESLKIINIPNSVINFGRFALSSCKSLEEITFPKSVRAIGEKMFLNCISLKEVTFLTPDLHVPTDKKALNTNDIFLGCNSLEKIIIPKNSSGTYIAILSYNFGKLQNKIFRQ